MKLDPHQPAPVEFLSKRRRALLVAPAGSGKTVIAAAALDRVLRAKPRPEPVVVGWVANTKEQAQQAESALAMFPEVQRLARVRVKCAAAGDDWSDCALLVVDECHHAAAEGWYGQIATCAGARWGMTATPDFEGDEAAWKAARLEELFGQERFTVDRKDVAHRLAAARVVVLDPAWQPGLAAKIDAETEKTYAYRVKRWGGDPQQLRAMVWWQKCVEVGIVGNMARSLTALDQAQRHVKAGDSVLVLVNQVEHAQWFADAVASATGLPATACHANMGAKARRHALYDFKQGTLKCVVATSLADEGLDVPRANVLVLVSGGRSRSKAEQRTGRVLRAFAGKERGIIYDFADSAHKLMSKHAAARQEVYRNLGYEVTYV